MFDKKTLFSRRTFVAAAGASALFAPAISVAQEASDDTRNIASFSPHQWQDHFDALGVGILMADTTGRFLQHWTADGLMRMYPTSVPMTDDLTRLGYTKVVRKRVAPSWTPTPSMRERDPDLPLTMAGGDQLNPLGSHALYLSWQYYLIHGTADTRKIGRRSSSGCIGLYNEQIAEVFGRTPVGTQVKLL